MKKCLVWDIDGTLAERTFLEEGTIQPLLPGRKDLCEDLAARGVLLSVASHNRLQDVQAMLHAWDLDHILLYPQGNLSESKAVMMQRIMDALNLTRREDLVLVDDDRGNLDEVKQAGFESWNVSNLDACILACFTKPEYNEDDRLRVQRYKDEERRDRAAQSYGDDRQAFLASLGIKILISKAMPEDMPRVCDLVARSNRFSALSHDFTDDELETHRAAGNLYTVHVMDKFGDYGLSSVFIDVAGYMPLLVVSCRLAGKGIGSAIVGYVINKNMGMLLADWKLTQYNESVAKLFEWYACAIESISSAHLQARRSANGLVELPSWITLL